MTRPIRTLVLVGLLLVSAFGVPGAFTGASTAYTSGSVSIDKAIDDQTRRTDLSFTVGATDNGTISMSGSPSTGDSDVSVSFGRWEDLDSGESGTSSSWTAQAGHRYRVTYQATVSHGASGGTDGSVDATTSISGPTASSSEQLSVSIDYQYPDIGYIGGQDTTVIFEGQSTASKSVGIDVPNTGSGSLKLTDIEVSNAPSGIDISTSDLPQITIGGATDTLTLDVTVQDSVLEGSHTVDITLVDNLPSTSDPTVPLTIDVEKPPVLGIGTIDVGDILVGSEKTTTFTINERGGFSGISGVNARVRGASQFATVTFSNLAYVSTSAGGSDQAKVTVSIDPEATQHSQVSWTVDFSPDDPDGVSTTANVQARVIYPGYFGAVTMPERTVTFDKPRSTTDSFTKRVEVSVENDGDKPLDITGSQARAETSYVDATVVDRPTSIDGLSSGTVVVELEADASAPEMTDDVTVTLQSADAGSASVTSTYEIQHDIALNVEQTSFSYGELDVTKSATKSTDIAEELGYKDVTGLQIQQVSGPNSWLTVVEQPSGTLDAGDSAPFVVETRFTADATLYQKYTWKFRVTADNAPSTNITVSARAKPFTVENIREPLTEYQSGDRWQATVSGGMVDSIDSLTEKLKQNEAVSRSDLPAVVAAARTAHLFIESASTARSQVDSGDYRNATTDIVRAAAAYNLMSVYVPRIEDPDASRNAEQARSAAKAELDSLIESQTEYYEGRLAADDVTAIERAAINHDLAKIMELQGDTETAAQHRAESRAAFDQYLSLVEAGIQDRVAAAAIQQDLTDVAFTVVFDYPLMLNPADWDRFTTDSERVLERYDESTEKFESAGAVEKAEETRERRVVAANQFQTARYSLYVASGIYIVGFGAFLRYLALGVYAYIRDAREAVTGDFLL